MAKEEALIRDRMREPLKKYMETEEDEALREALREYAEANYRPSIAVRRELPKSEPVLVER